MKTASATLRARKEAATAWLLLHRAARIWLALAGIRLEQVDQSGPATGEARLLVANHASYLDGLLLIAALPAPGGRFVAKRELLRNRLVTYDVSAAGFGYLFATEDSQI